MTNEQRQALINALGKARELRDGQPLLMDPVRDPDQRKCVAQLVAYLQEALG